MDGLRATANINSLQHTVVQMRNLYRPMIEKALVTIEVDKAHQLEATEYTMDLGKVEIPTVVDDPFKNYDVTKQRHDGREFREIISNMKNQMNLLGILEAKRQCPISRTIDAI